MCCFLFVQKRQRCERRPVRNNRWVIRNFASVKRNGIVHETLRCCCSRRDARSPEPNEMLYKGARNKHKTNYRHNERLVIIVNCICIYLARPLPYLHRFCRRVNAIHRSRTWQLRKSMYVRDKYAQINEHTKRWSVVLEPATTFVSP